MSDLKFVSLADSTFEKLENCILSGEYGKGETLTELKLSELLGISRTPIREAIKRLEQEGLVKLTSRGILVVGLSAEDIDDIYEIRSNIEGIATARCAKLISDENIAKLKEIVELQEFYTSKQKAENINLIDSEFHEFLFSNCGSEVFKTVLSGLHRKIQKYRKISVQDNERAKAAVIEHKRIYEAIEKHDTKLAEELARTHIENARKNILNNIGK